MMVTVGAPLFDFVTLVKTRMIVPGAQPQDKVLSRGLVSAEWADSSSLWGSLVRSVPVSWAVVATDAVIAWKDCGHGVVFRVHRPADVPQLRTGSWDTFGVDVLVSGLALAPRQSLITAIWTVAS